MIKRIKHTSTGAQRARQASLVRLVQASVDETGAQRVILFSPDADQGRLEDTLAGLTVPVAGHGASLPGAVETDPSALVVCNCVLERQSLKQIPDTIDALARLSSHALLLVRTRYAGEVVDGEESRASGPLHFQSAHAQPISLGILTALHKTQAGIKCHSWEIGSGSLYPQSPIGKNGNHVF